MIVVATDVAVSGASTVPPSMIIVLKDLNARGKVCAPHPKPGFRQPASCLLFPSRAAGGGSCYFFLRTVEEAFFCFGRMLATTLRSRPCELSVITSMRHSAPMRAFFTISTNSSGW